MLEELLAETLRCYGHPAELRKGVLGVAVVGGFGGMWLTTRARTRAAERRAWRELLALLRAEPSLPPWKPWVQAVCKAP